MRSAPRQFTQGCPSEVNVVKAITAWPKTAKGSLIEGRKTVRALPCQWAHLRDCSESAPRQLRDRVRAGVATEVACARRRKSRIHAQGHVSARLYSPVLVFSSLLVAFFTRSASNLKDHAQVIKGARILTGASSISSSIL